MGVSETVIAASIGAGATLITALVQLMGGVRAQSKLDFRQKKGSALRSIFAIVALMIASGVTGYLYAEYRNASASQDLHAIRDELNAKLAVLTTTTERLAASRSSSDSSTVSKPIDPSSPVDEAKVKAPELTVYVPACVGECTEATAQVVPVCVLIPRHASVGQVDLFVGEANAANINASGAISTGVFTQVEVEHEFNSTRFVGPPTTSAHSDDSNICVSFKHWSEKPHLARIMVRPHEVSNESNLKLPTAISAEVQKTALITQ